MFPLYFRGADASIIAFSVSDRQSFDSVETIYENILCNADCVNPSFIFLCGNYYDIYKSREVSFEEGMEKAQKLGIEYFETIPKTGDGIEDMLKRITKKYLAQIPKQTKNPDSNSVRRKEKNNT